MRDSRTQRGFTLIELMVSLLIGLLLIAGILSVFVNSKRSYNTRDSLSLMEENGRVALLRLQRGIAAAGYPLYDDVVPVVFTGTSIPSVEVSSNQNGSDNLGDRITVAFRPTGLTTEDCLGGDTVHEGLIINSYFVNDDNTLQCDGGTTGRSQPLAEGIESLQALYGLDEDGDGYADHYLNADQMNTAISASPDQQLNVVSVQLSVLVNSQHLARDNKPSDDGLEPNTFTLLDTQVKGEDDFMVRKVFSSTIPLRNRIPLCDDCD